VVVRRLRQFWDLLHALLTPFDLRLPLAPRKPSPRPMVATLQRPFFELRKELFQPLTLLAFPVFFGVGHGDESLRLQGLTAGSRST